ncbi:MAG: HAD family phosphatase [Candidatus Riflebacteria bacterium]|nr:HAD family phosphatase [Candidatus Riflebacteria bacterium]
MNKAVIFDMDGVLADTEPAYIEVNRKFLTSSGIDFSNLDYSEFIGMAAPRMWSRLKEMFLLPQSLEWLIANEKNNFFSYIQQLSFLAPIPGIPETLRQLRSEQIKIGLASSSFRKNIDQILKKTELNSFFEKITSGEEVENGKPAPDIFLLAAQKLNIQPNFCLVIEDSNNGVQAAVKAGMTCVGFRNPTSENQDLSVAKLLIDDFSQNSIEAIFELLREIGNN